MLEWPEFLDYLSGFACFSCRTSKNLTMRPPEDLKAELGFSHEALQVALKDQIPSLSDS